MHLTWHSTRSRVTSLESESESAASTLLLYSNATPKTVLAVLVQLCAVSYDDIAAQGQR